MAEIWGWGCPVCRVAYKEKPVMCHVCGSDLFAEVVEVDGKLKFMEVAGR
jgi:rRNA maturation endonuclease Nob1